MAPDAEEKKPRRSAKPKRRSAVKRSPARSAVSREGSTVSRGARQRLGGLRVGEAISLVAAVLLLILMFFDWFGIKATGGAEQAGGLVSGSGGGSAWEALEVIPLFLMLAIVVAVGAALLKLARSEWKPAIPAAAVVCLLGLLAALLILIRIISPPGPDGALAEVAFDSTLKLPVFLALAAALGIAYGGWRTMGEEGTTFGGIAKRLESPERPKRPAKPRPAKAAAEPKPAKDATDSKPKGAAKPRRPTRRKTSS
jgi:cation transport ATPase